MIHSLKFRQRHAQARLLGRLLAERILEENAPLPNILIPIPLHPSRYKQRGFNQALEIARSVARSTGTRLESRLCQRARETDAQASLSARTRHDNIRNAFTIRSNWTACPHVAILDDVMTTGATTAEMARTLRAAGVARIDVWSCARALKLT